MICQYRAVHPHRRGEHPRLSIISLKLIGSSPQAWGTYSKWDIASGAVRFIPTGVGNIFPKVVGNSLTPVHPHRRGEHNPVSCRAGNQIGSSPQAWGTFPAYIPFRPACRFIPTGVGNMVKFVNIHRPAPVHPHRRGEHWKEKSVL